MINQTKKTLRALYKEIRGGVNDRNTKNNSITEFVLSSEEYRNADSVFVYWSVGSEVDTSVIIEKALVDGKRVALPKCTDKDGNMSFYYIDALSSLVDGMYGIKEPPTDIPADDFTMLSLCLVPALSFDTEGFRLGYGKGYYDRFLSLFSGVTMGLCYEECLCKSLPRDCYDKKVNYIITDDKIYDLR